MILNAECQRPSFGCTGIDEHYKTLDCDGDGVLDHACSTAVNDYRHLILSSEGCPNSWGSSYRSAEECREGFGG